MSLSMTLLASCAVDDVDDVSSTDQAATGENGLHGAPEHLFLGKGEAGGPPSRGGVSMLTYRGGAVLSTSKTFAIFWGAQWSSAAFAGDKITGLDDFFYGYGGSNYAKASTEYCAATTCPGPSQVTDSVTYLGHTIDTTTVPTKALSTTAAVAEGCKIAANNPDPNALYLIYTATGAGHVSYCAWHSWGTCSNGMPIQVAYMPNIDGIAGCSPTSPAVVGTDGHSQGLTAVANVTAHELSEAITDPRGKGWVDAGGSENGDKCAWAFPTNADGGSVTFASYQSTTDADGVVTPVPGTKWRLQGEWSNAAAAAGTGFASRDGYKACLPFN